jgi:DNA-binding CsgD family transcriptional regulator
MCPVLVDREEALATVGAEVAGAAAGRGGVVFVVGEAGIGKSRLAAEAAAVAGAAGMTTLRGRAVDRAAPPPYRPLAEAIQPVLLEPSEAGGAAASSRRALRPLLGDTGQGAGEAGELAVAEALARLLGVAGRRGGCLLLLEDLHWSDPETLAVVEYLADHLGDQRTLLLATVRSGEASRAERLAGLLGDRRAAVVVPLRRLGADATDRMLAACLGSADVPAGIRRFVQDRADGVPLFVEEVLVGLAESGALVRTGDGWRVTAPLTSVVPVTYAEAVRRRMHALSPVDRDVLLAAAVLGRRFRWSLLPATTGHDEASVLDALRRAAQRLLVEPDDDPDAFRFRHALARDAVLGELLPPEQAAIARRALAALDASPEVTADGPDLLAELAERAGDRPRAVEALVAVARGALHRGALTTARTALQRAERLGRPLPELAALVDETASHAAALAGDVDEAIRRAALVLARLPAGPASAERRARLHLTLARAASVAGRWSDASRHVADALGLAVDGGPALRAEAQALAAHVALGEGRVPEAVALAGSAVGGAEPGGAPAAACEALEVLGRVARLTDIPEGERLFAEALAVADRHDLALWRARALHELGTIDLYSSRRADRLELARAAAVEAGAVATIAVCDLHLATSGYAQWEPEAGIAAGRRCVELSRRLGLDTLGMGLVHLATCHAVAGDAERMEAVLAEAAAFVADEPDVAVGIPGRARLALAVSRGDVTAARAALDEAMAAVRAHPERHYPFRGLWALVCSLEGTGDGGAAARAEAAAAPAGGALFNGYCLAFADAVALGRAGRGDDALAALAPDLVEEQRVEALGPWAAVALALLASAALRDGWGDGERWMRHALALLDSRGLAEMASWCRAVLRAEGRPVPRRRGDTAPPSDLRALGVTSREVDVLALVAAGASNKEIAGRLHLSPRTVERHVSNLLTKTGATDRRALGRLAERVDRDGRRSLGVADA